ncbi:MAG: hypothetical protein ACRDL3_07190 [Solirubrobacterales bacterium]
MRQVTLRLPDRLADAVKQFAAKRDQSVNAYATEVLSAAVDPDLAGTEAERLRARLARAGVLDQAPRERRSRPPDSKLREARARAGRGRSLSDLVSEGRR